MSSRGWTAEQIPPLDGRVFVVTGATSGLGLETTRALAAHGARVVLAVRDEDKGRRVAAEQPGALTVRRLDLTDFASVRAFAAGLHDEFGSIDVLINNAGVMATRRTLTADGHEVQFAANHLGHFALTGLLLDLLTAGRDPRVVTVTSSYHRRGRLRFDDPTGERSYSPMAFYNTTKLANAIFGWELHRRLTAAGSPVRSVLAHPGYAATNLQVSATTTTWMVMLARIGNPVLGQSALRGARSQLYAATVPEVAGGQLIGPGGPGELRGDPKPVKLSAAATDPENGRRLWEVSEKATGVHFGLPVA
jgi:NAD(P)-dependent dehydrogenase (short-subunit alcohol dehydrogenase family)